MIRILYFWNELRTRGWTIFLLGLKKYDKTDIFRLRSVRFSKEDFQKKFLTKLYICENTTAFLLLLCELVVL